MGTVQQLAATVQEGIQAAHPKLRQPVINNLALAVGAMLEAQTPNTSELATVLPVPTERQDRREQGWRRLLTTPLLERPALLEPFARTGLEEAAHDGQTVILSLDQTALGDRFAGLRRAVQVGDRSLPWAWPVAAGAATIGVAGQPVLLDRVRAWLPPGAAVLLRGERFYPSADLVAWVQRYGWPYRRRLNGNLTVDTGVGEATTGELAQGISERDLPNVRLVTPGVPTHLGILQEAGHEAPGMIALDGWPTRAAVRDDGARWAIDPLFSDVKRRGFPLEATPRRAPDRLDRLSLSMALARYGCGRVGRPDALYHPTAIEKKPRPRPIFTMGA